MEEHSDYSKEQIRKIRSYPAGSKAAQVLEVMGYCIFPIPQSLPKAFQTRMPAYALDEEPCNCFESLNPKEQS